MSDEEIQMLERNLELQEEVMSRFQSDRQGATSELQYLERLNIVTQTEGQLKQARVERLANIRTKPADSTTQIRTRRITSPSHRGFCQSPLSSAKNTGRWCCLRPQAQRRGLCRPRHRDRDEDCSVRRCKRRLNSSRSAL